MPRELQRPLSRQEANVALIANALTKTWPNVVVPAGLAAGGVLLGLPLYVLIIAAVAWMALAAITYFDEGEADEVIGRLRSGRREQLLRAEPRVDLGALAPPIADHLERVMTQERRIRDAIDRAELPFEEVSQEVDTFVRAAERAAARAQLLYEYLSEEDPRRVEGRLEQLRAGGPSEEPGAQALADALETQLRAMKRVHQKLERFYGEMERIAIELANVRGQLLSVSATTEATAQRELATGVRNLREHVGAVAEGMSEVLDETRATAT